MEPLDQKEMMVSQEIQALMWVCLCFSSVLEAFFLALDLSFYLSIPFWQSMPKGCELCVWLPWRTLEFRLIVFLSNIRNHTFLLCWWLTLIVCLISFLFLHCKSFTYMFYCSHFSAFALTLAFCSAAVHTWSEQNVCLCVCVRGEERETWERGCDRMQLCICCCQGYQEMSADNSGAALAFICLSVCMSQRRRPPVWDHLFPCPSVQP